VGAGGADADADADARMDVDAIRERVRSTALLQAGRSVLVMLSGGRDSVCLLDVAVALCDPAAVRALHVNYGLRAGADGDEHHCRTLCRTLGVELHVERARRDDADAPDTPAEGEPAGETVPRNLQAWAREVRYAVARELARGDDALIATAHTASDQVETILYRLAASPGRRALLGMRASDRGVVRPLLSLTRAQTASYCEQRDLSWREDESNEDLRFARARVRTGVVPALRSVHSAAEANVLRTAELLREESELLDELVDERLGARSVIALDELAALPAALARLLVIRLAEDVAGTYVPQAGVRVAEILALGAHGAPAQVHVGAGVAAVVHGGMLEMVRLAPRAGA
jgi:tRNA(Ile)-lysidine synthase